MKKQNKNTTSASFRQLLPYVKSHGFALALSIVLAAVSVILQLYVPILFGDAIDQTIAAHRVDFVQMWRYLRLILLVATASALCTWLMNLLNNRMTYHIVQDIRSRAIRHIQKLPLSYLDKHSSGDIVSRIITDTDSHLQRILEPLVLLDVIKLHLVSGIRISVGEEEQDGCK